MIPSRLKLTLLPIKPFGLAERMYGAFRVLDSNGAIFEEYGLDESEASDLAIWLNGSIEHMDPNTGEWFNW